MPLNENPEDNWLHTSTNELLARLVADGNTEDGSIGGDEEDESLYEMDRESVESEHIKPQNVNEKPPKLIKEQGKIYFNFIISIEFFILVDLTPNIINTSTSSVSLQDAYKSFCVFRQYAEENWSDSKVLDACHELEGFLYKEKVKHRASNGNN